MDPLNLFDPTLWILFLSTLGLSIIGMAIQIGSGKTENQADDEHGRSKKRRKRRPSRSKNDRGLPSQKLLREMAEMYLAKQRELWPECDRLGLFRGLDAATLADQFAERFRNNAPCTSIDLRCQNFCKAIAGAYVRFSCDKSNPRSLVQQLSLILVRAKANGHFVPWELVFADAAISATTAIRRGYLMAKEAVNQADSPLSILYIDEMGRASRDAVETVQLGRLITRRGKRLMGVSDAFDSDLEMSKLHLHFFAMHQELFVDQLKAKVNRGMADAFGRGTNLRPPAIGYRLVPAVDGKEKPIWGRDGERLNMLEIDPAEAEYVKLAFRLFGERGRSRTSIARYFNRHQVGNQSWDASRLKQVFQRHKYVGINIENMTYHEVDVDEDGVEKRVKKNRPRSEWRVRRDRNLQIVPWSLWKKVKRRLADSQEAYGGKPNREKNRSDVNPTTLVRPICGSCGNPMRLGKSGKYASFTCLNGREGKHGCKHRGYKSVKIVETMVLNHVLDTILTDARIQQLVEAANSYLHEETTKPSTDTSGWKKELKSVSTKRERLADIVENEENRDIRILLNRLSSYEEKMRELRAAIREAETQQQELAEISVEETIGHLSSVRELLRHDTPQAALLLREITGPVVIRLEEEEGKKSDTWYADFAVNLVPVALQLSREAGCPSTGTWEYLNTRSWAMPIESRVRLEHVTQYERLGPLFAELHRKGAKVQEIASVYGMPWKQAKEILDFGMTGERPKWPTHAHPGNGSDGPPLYQRIREDVVRLRDEEQRTWLDIITWFAREKELSVSEATVRRAYDSAQLGDLRATVEGGETPKRGTWRRLPPEKVKLMRDLLKAGKFTPAEIAERAGVGISTVYRERGAMQNDG